MDTLMLLTGMGFALFFPVIFLLPRRNDHASNYGTHHPKH